MIKVKINKEKEILVTNVNQTATTNPFNQFVGCNLEIGLPIVDGSIEKSLDLSKDFIGINDYEIFDNKGNLMASYYQFDFTSINVRMGPEGKLQCQVHLSRSEIEQQSFEKGVKNE